MNPFKFGSVVEGIYFTNRVEEIAKVKQVLKSRNHLIIVSPRRFGKTSLITKVLNEVKRPYIYMDLQTITSKEDFASQLLKRVYRAYPFERIKQLVKSFRIIPNISLNPFSSEVEITFQALNQENSILEDVFNLLERVSSSKKRLIVVLDEFQEIMNIDSSLDKYVRAIIQLHKRVNYVFLGSQESLMREIFEQKKSSFYHFGNMMILEKIGYEYLDSFIKKSFKKIKANQLIAGQILQVTKCHPYYTQRLGYSVWELLNRNANVIDPVQEAISELIKVHDMDFERLWNRLNRTDMKILIGLASGNYLPLGKNFANKFGYTAGSTIFSGLKRLMESGMVIKTENGYEIDDPFFARWIVERRGR